MSGYVFSIATGGTASKLTDIRFANQQSFGAW
jgi:hypothetical protein